MARHPRPGGYSYGHGRGYYGHGHGYYGRGYGHGHYSHYRSYPYYPYYGYGYYPYYGYGSYGLGLGIGFYFGSGYADAGYRAPYAVEYPGAYESRQGEPVEEYIDRGERRNGNGTETAELRLIVGPDDAVVYVDDKFRGTASRLVSVRVTPGRHRVEVVRPGFAVAEREVHVGPGATASLQIELERR